MDDCASGAFRFGALGVGKITRTRFLPSTAQIHSIRVAALGTRDPDRVRDEGLVNPPTQLLTYEALVREGRSLVDGVYIGLPNDLHEEWVIRCAEAGLHVLCEKPLSADPGTARRCREACRHHGVLLAEAFMYRHDPRHHRVREAIRAGRIGTVSLIEATFTYLLEDPRNIRLRPERRGGALMDVGCYGIDLARFLLGEEPETVTARGVVGAATGVDELVAVTLGFASGPMAVVTAATRLARTHAYQVRGTTGTITVPAAFVPPEAEPTCLVIEAQGQPPATEEFPPCAVFARQVEHFVRAARAGDPALLPPTEDGCDNARILGAAVRSLADGR